MRLPVRRQPVNPSFDVYHVGQPDEQIAWEDIFENIVQTTAERNFDFYEVDDGAVRRLPT